MNISKSQWKIAPIGFSIASKMVEKYHYSHGCSTQFVAIHGLFMIQDDYNVLPYGLCWWMPPASPSVARYCSEDMQGVLSLSRMVLTPDAPRNAASFLLSRSIKALPEKYHTLVTYADTWQGHTGGIYKATNWHYDGLTAPEPVYINEQGRVVSDRSGKKTYSASEMVGQYTRVGYYRKHRFIFYRERKSKSEQSNMFGEFP